MKKYIFLLSVVLSFLGCEKEMMDYEGKDGVYFAVQQAPPSLYGNPEVWAYMDTTLIPFSLLLENDSTVMLKVRVMGNVVDHDRYFTLSVVDSLTTATEGEDYAPLETRYVIPAGERDGYVSFTGFRQAKMLDSTYYVALQLEENEYFSLPMDLWRPLEYSDYTDEIQNVIRHVVGLTDEVFLPKAWTKNYFGPYSKKKVKLLCEMFDLQMADFDDVIKMDMERQRTYAQGLDKYLKEMEAKGETVYEDEKDKDGNPVKMAVGPLV